MSTKNIATKVPFAVQQKFKLYEGNKDALKQFLLAKSTEERELYQEYLSKELKKVKYIPIAYIAINIPLCYILDPIILYLTIPFIVAPIYLTTDRYDRFYQIQQVFDEVDAICSGNDYKSKQ